MLGLINPNHYSSSLLPMLDSLVHILAVKLVQCLVGEESFQQAILGHE